MSYGRAYTAGQQVKIDKGVVEPVPTLGECYIDAEVLADSNAAHIEVNVKPEGYPALDVLKDRVTP